MDLFLPKVSMNTMSVEADPNKSLSNVLGCSDGEANLFSLLMDGITGENVEEILDQNAEFKKLPIDVQDSIISQTELNIGKVPKSDMKNIVNFAENIPIEEEILLDLKREIDPQQLKEQKEVLEAQGKATSPVNLLHKMFKNKPEVQAGIFAKELANGSKMGVGKKQVADDASQNLKPLSTITIKDSLKQYSNFDNSSDVGMISSNNSLESATSNMRNGLGLNNNFDNKIQNLSNSDLNTINLGTLEVTGTSDVEILKEITNHLDKMKLSGAKELSVTVKHNELGRFQISANEIGRGDVSKLNMEITTNSKDVQNFFKTNELGLTTLLSEKGFNVGSFKIGQGFSEELSKDDGFSSNYRSFSGNQSRGE